MAAQASCTSDILGELSALMGVGTAMMKDVRLKPASSRPSAAGADHVVNENIEIALMNVDLATVDRAHDVFVDVDTHNVRPARANVAAVGSPT